MHCVELPTDTQPPPTKLQTVARGRCQRLRCMGVACRFPFPSPYLCLMLSQLQLYAFSRHSWQLVP
jgi:hypothetical protein